MLTFSSRPPGGHVAGLVGDFVVRPPGRGSGNDRLVAALTCLGQQLAAPDAVVLERPILSPEEWLDDPYFSGPLGRELWPQKKLDFVAAAQGHRTEVVLTGAIGYGKSALLKAIALYDLYRMSCFAEPQRALGVGATESLVFVLISLNLLKARAKLFTPFKNAVDATPYFRLEFPYDPKRESALFFPKNILVKPGVTGEAAIHSEDVIFVGLSEANFLPVVRDSRKKRGGETLDVAADLVEAVLFRMKSRFLQGEGRLPMCRLVLDSSRQYPDDFLERRIGEIERGEIGHGAIVISRSIWEAKAGVRNAAGELYFSGETFPVEVGNEARVSRVLDEDEVFRAKGRVVRVAVELREEFARDVERALREFGGVAVLSLRPLIADRAAILACVRDESGGYAASECEHPFTAVETSLRDGVRFLEEALVNPATRKPRIRPDHLRCAHVDFGLTSDCLGLAVGHVSEVGTVTRATDGASLDLPCTACRGARAMTCPRCEGRGRMTHFRHQVRCSACRGEKLVTCASCRGTGRHGVAVVRPWIYVDLALRVVPPETGQIQFDDVEALLRRLRGLGFQIPVVTADGYESAQFLQRQLKDGAQVAETLSVDKTKDAYYALRNAVMDRDAQGRRRVSFYHYEPFIQELARVEDRPHKIDHPHNYSKDVSDAVAGVVYNCERFDALQHQAAALPLSVARY